MPKLRSYTCTIQGYFKTNLKLITTSAAKAKALARDVFRINYGYITGIETEINHIAVEAEPAPPVYRGDIGILKEVLDQYFDTPQWGWTIYNDKRKDGTRRLKLESADVIDSSSLNCKTEFAERLEHEFSGRVVEMYCRLSPARYGEPTVTLNIVLRDWK